MNLRKTIWMFQFKSIDIVRNCVYNYDNNGGVGMGYISVRQASKKWNISVRRVQALCEQGRVNGANKVGNAYIIPEDAKKPKDMRKKNSM